MADLSIYDAITQVRDDIRKLQADLSASGATPQMQIESCEIELKAVARSESSAEGGAKAKLKIPVIGEFGADAKGSIGEYAEHVQTIKIRLTGIGVAGGPDASDRNGISFGQPAGARGVPVIETDHDYLPKGKAKKK